MELIEIDECAVCFEGSAFCVVLDGKYYPFPEKEQAEAAMRDSPEEFAQTYLPCEGCRRAAERRAKQLKAVEKGEA
jgi:hypothetical protein